MTDLAAALDTLRAAEADLATRQAVSLPSGPLGPVVVGTVTALPRGSWWVPGLRERAGGVLRGASVERLVDARAGAKPYKIAPVSPSPALRALHAVGLALAEPTQAVAVHLGAGSVADGAFVEALDLAVLRGAPVVFVVAAPALEGAPVPPQTAIDVRAVAAAHGVYTFEVDGADAEAVHGAVTEALSRAIDGPGPVLVRAALP